MLFIQLFLIAYVRYAYLYVGCPTAVTITASYGPPYPVGVVFTCEHDGYPDAAMTYAWTGTNTGSGSTITLTDEGDFELTCTVTGNFSTPCTASNSVSGSVDGKKQFTITQPTRPTQPFILSGSINE